MGTKLAYWDHEVSAAKTLKTPEFDKKVLWNKVKDNEAFKRYIPDNLIRKPERLPKEWLWRIISKFNPEFAQRYSKRALKIATEKKRTKSKVTITVAP